MRHHRSERAEQVFGFRSAFLAVLAIVFLAPLGSGCGFFDRSAPVLQVDRDSVDLGDFAMEEWAETTFILRNVGDEALEFARPPWVLVEAGCCPPVPFLGSLRIEPGDSTTLSLRFTMAGDMEGFHDFRVRLPSNDPVWDERTLKVLSNWIPADSGTSSPAPR